jgi:hypothetical protein
LRSAESFAASSSDSFISGFEAFFGSSLLFVVRSAGSVFQYEVMSSRSEGSA